MNLLKKRFIFFAIAMMVLSFSSGVLGQGKSKEKKKNPGNLQIININTATEKELVTLKRVGMKIAKRIIRYREKNGPFEKPSDIMKVSGIGKRTFEMNKDRMVVSE